MYPLIYHKLQENGKIKTAMILSGPDTGRKCLVENGLCISEDGWDWKPYEEAIAVCKETQLLTVEETTIFVEVYEKNPHLIILGGGHVSCPVAQIGKLLSFHVTVMDDREEFVTRERFPDADVLLKGTFEELNQKIPVYENAYYVVVTRGHAGDSACARQILKRPFAYFGMIGSKTKVKISREKLLEEGFTVGQLDQIHAPIGLPIGGQMPAEIAVSIMAQIVQVKNQYQVSFSDEKVEEAVQAGKHGVMMTIVKKSGSSPRGVGSKMFLDEAGTLYGSIGGGSVEYEAIVYGKEVRETEVQSYDLSVADTRNLHMICGGNVEVVFERV